MPIQEVEMFIEFSQEVDTINNKIHIINNNKKLDRIKQDLMTNYLYRDIPFICKKN